MTDFPVYVIVELSARIGLQVEALGNYITHAHFDDGVVVTTARGIIMLDAAIIMKQYRRPTEITIEDLNAVTYRIKNS